MQRFAHSLSLSITNLFRFRQALLLLLKRDLRQRYAGTLLGASWLVLQPLFLLIVYSFVFGFLLRIRFEPNSSTLSFALYLMAGLLPFSAFQESVMRGASALVDNRSLVDKAAFPLPILPMVVTLSSIIIELIGLAVLILAVFVINGTLSPWLVLLPLLVLVRWLLSLGVVWFVSVLMVFFRDLAQILSMLLTLLFFATPIIYPASLVPENWIWIYQINPFYYLVEAYRSVIIAAEAPAQGVLIVAGFGVVLTWLGLLFFGRTLERAKEFI